MFVRSTVALSCALISWSLLVPGTVAQESPAKSFGKSAVSFQQDVLVTDPAGKGRGISAPSLSLPGGFRYQVRVRFTPEKVDREHREDFLRSVTLYEGRSRPGADCTSAACWFSMEEIASEPSRQEKFHDVPKDTRWLIAVWQITPQSPEGEDRPPGMTCQEVGCWKIEDVQEGSDHGVVLEVSTPDQTTSITVLQRPMNGKKA
jgi:hypothetical protein